MIHTKPLRRQIGGLAIVVVLFCNYGLAADKPAPTATTDTVIPLKVMYVGNPGSERMADFKKLLSTHFLKVGTANYEKFQPQEADGFDVVVLDWTSSYARDKDGKLDDENGVDRSAKSVPKLSVGYAKPTVMIGAAAGTMHHIAINWK